MPRKHRTFMSHSVHHVMLRGNNKNQIFFHPSQHDIFYDYLKSAIDKFNCKVHLFCLMTNHIHLVIETGLVPLSKVMQSITRGFTLKINKIESRTGHLFQGRFKSKLVTSARYLAELCFYIHYNPIAANMVNDINSYPWSSHHSYLQTQVQDWVSIELVSSVLSVVGAKDYQEFIQIKLTNVSEENMQFYETNDINLSHKIQSRLNPLDSSEPLQLPLKQLIAMSCEYLNIELETLSSVSLARTLCNARAVISYVAHYHAGYLIKEIALEFEQQSRTVGQAMHRFVKHKNSAELVQQLLTYLRKLKQ